MINGLQAALYVFEMRAKSYGTIRDEGIELCVCNGYITFFTEVEDKNEETIACSQEVIFEDDKVTTLYFVAE